MDWDLKKSQVTFPFDRRNGDAKDWYSLKTHFTFPLFLKNMRKVGR